jgi:hypothetical protein
VETAVVRPSVRLWQISATEMCPSTDGAGHSTTAQSSPNIETALPSGTVKIGKKYELKNNRLNGLNLHRRHHFKITVRLLFWSGVFNQHLCCNVENAAAYNWGLSYGQKGIYRIPFYALYKMCVAWERSVKKVETCCYINTSTFSCVDWC